MQISTHTPAWGATLLEAENTDNFINFNSHARVGRDDMFVVERAAATKISTHTPAWGATWRNDPEHYADGISTHTPAWGATVGGTTKIAGQEISTHTPAWGATFVAK